MEYLGLWVTRTGILSVNKKVEAIVNMMLPMNQKQVCSFIGLVNYYRDMWAKRSHLLQTLTALTSKEVKFKWTHIKKNAFDDIKQIVTRDALLIYPDLNENFDIHTDDSELQLGEVIS